MYTRSVQEFKLVICEHAFKLYSRNFGSGVARVWTNSFQMEMMMMLWTIHSGNMGLFMIYVSNHHLFQTPLLSCQPSSAFAYIDSSNLQFLI